MRRPQVDYQQAKLEGWKMVAIAEFFHARLEPMLMSIRSKPFSCFVE
jgi:hypothetical protein